MTQKPPSDPVAKVTVWITPFLLAIIGWFTISKLDKIEARLDSLEGVKTEIALLKEKDVAYEGRISKIEQSLFSFISLDKLVGKHEEVYKLPKKPNTD